MNKPPYNGRSYTKTDMFASKGKKAVDSRYHRKLVMKVFSYGRLVWQRPAGDYLYVAPRNMWLMPSNNNRDQAEVLSNVNWETK